MHEELDAIRINPNPWLVALVNYAIDEIAQRLSRRDEYAEWLEWAKSWKAGRRSPEACVNVAHRCFDHAKNAQFSIGHTLGQIAWGAKEACYDVPQSGWLVVRYIADAMIAFGVTFPKEAMSALEPPTVESAANARVLEQVIAGPHVDATHFDQPS